MLRLLATLIVVFWGFSAGANEWRGPFDYSDISVSFQAGHEANGDPIYIGMVLHENVSMKGVHFEKINKNYVQQPRVASYRGAWVFGRWTSRYDGVLYTQKHEEHFAKKFLIFDPKNSDSFSWIKAKDGALPANAVQAWGSNNDQYLCRATWAGGQFPGRFMPSQQACLFSFGGREVTVFVYEILVRVAD